MAIEDVLNRISAIQARFGTRFTGVAEFDGLVSDAARHGGLGRDDEVAAAASPSGGGATTGASTSNDGASGSTDAGVAEAQTVGVQVEEPASAGGASPSRTVGVQVDEPANEPGDAFPAESPTSGGAISGEALEALAATLAGASAASPLGTGTGGSSTLLELVAAAGADGDGVEMLASIIAQQQAGAGLDLAADS